MTAIVAAIGGKVIAWVVAGVAGLLALLFARNALKSAGAADQRAAETQKELTDVATATKARSDVDALADSAVDDRLRQFQRK